MPSSDAMHFFFGFLDAVDDALERRTDPLALAADLDLLSAWMRMAPAETWALVLEQAFACRELRLPEHWEGADLDVALALHGDAQAVEFYGDWEPAVAMPPQSVQLATLTFYMTCVRLRVGASRAPHERLMQGGL